MLKREIDLETHPFEKYMEWIKSEADRTIIFNLLDVKEDAEWAVSCRYVELFT